MPTWSGGTADNNKINSTPFIGRRDELESIEKSMERALQGQGSTVIISGSAGIGKTYLAKEIARIAALNGFQIFEGSCNRFEGRIRSPFSGIIDKADNAQGSKIEDLSWSNVEAQRFEVMRRIRAITSSRPLAIFIDDLQWADQATLNIFQHVARNIGVDRVLLTAMVRSEELALVSDERIEALVEIIKILRTKAIANNIRLEPLSDQEVGEFIARTLGGMVEERLIKHMLDASKGNPLFLAELMAYMRRSNAIVRGTEGWTIDVSKAVRVPDAISGVIQARLRLLKDPQRELIEGLSILGNVFPTEIGKALATKLGQDVGRAWSSLDMEQGLIQTGEKNTSFSHDVVQKSILGAIKSEMKDYLHLAAAESILGTSYSNDDGLLSYHFLEGGDLSRALDHSLRAARGAIACEANRDAMIFYQRVLRSLDGPSERARTIRFEAYERLGDIYHIIARFDTSEEMFRQALFIASSNEERARSMRKMANSIGYHEGETNLRKALDLLSDTDMLPDVSIDEKAEILSQRCSFYVKIGMIDEAIESSRNASTMFHSIGEVEKEIWQKVNTSFYLINKGTMLEAEKELSEVRGELDPGIRKIVHIQYHTASCELNFQVGKYEQALENINVLCRLNPELGLFSDMSYNLWLKGIILDIQGSYKEALGEGLRSLELANVDEMRRALIRSKVLVAHSYLMLDKLKESERMLEEVSELFEQPFETTFVVGPSLYWVTLAELHRAKGLDELATIEAKKGLETIVLGGGNEPFMPVVLLWNGRSLLRSGSEDEGRANLSRAVEILQHQGNMTFSSLIKERYF